MRGIVQDIQIYRGRCTLIDRNGVKRSFTRGDMAADQNIGKYDAVQFDLDGNAISNVTRVGNHVKGIVISFGG